MNDRKKVSKKMKGKERDKQLAENLRDEFISQYKDLGAFRHFVAEMPANCIDRMIHCLKNEVNINIFRDYSALRTIAEDVKEHKAKEVYEEICAIDDARAWINDNGKYALLTFDALYKVYRRQEGLKAYIKTDETKMTTIQATLKEEAEVIEEKPTVEEAIEEVTEEITEVKEDVLQEEENLEEKSEEEKTEEKSEEENVGQVASEARGKE